MTTGYTGADMATNLHLLVLGLSWIVYGALHSVLAASGSKRLFRNWFPDHYSAYRLVYNLLALLLLIPPLWLLFSFRGAPLWHWPPALAWLFDGAALLAVAGFVWSTRYYDTGEFAGLKQLRERAQNDEYRPPLRLSPLHRWVRHPWYFFGLVILWTREMNAALLVTALVLTLYFVIGSRLEDNKLVDCYGEPYRRYRDRIPGLVPLPWRHLSRQDTADILASSAGQGLKPR